MRLGHSRAFCDPDIATHWRPMNRGLHLTVVIGACLFARDARAQAHLDLPVVVRSLPNGLEVILAPDPSLSEASVAVRYRVGSADDPDGLEGLAHLVEHLQFQGSQH